MLLLWRDGKLLINIVFVCFVVTQRVQIVQNLTIMVRK